MNTRRPLGEVRANQRVAYRLTPRIEVPVVGCTFRPDYPRSIHLLADTVAFAQRAERDDQVRDHLKPGFRRLVDVALVAGAVPIELRREPDNEVDPKAVAVWVPLIECGSIGFVPATTHGRIAGRLADALDAGERWGGWVKHVRIHPDHPDRPGIDIVIERQRG